MRYRVALSVLSIGIAAVVSAGNFCAASAEAADNPAPKLANAPGGQGEGWHVFMAARCFACHGEYGFGGVGPRFRENRFLGMTDYVVGQILIGRDVMPSYAEALNDRQIAAVASYIRSNWGNGFGPVNVQEVAKVRQQVQLHPPQGRPHVPADVQQPNPASTPPQKNLPPGQALPPKNP